MKQLTEVRRMILQNIKDGKDPYKGFEGSQLGGAIRSVQVMRRVRYLINFNRDTEKYFLTPAGEAALKTGEYDERPVR